MLETAVIMFLIVAPNGVAAVATFDEIFPSLQVCEERLPEFMANSRAELAEKFPGFQMLAPQCVTERQIERNKYPV